jgi:hypothetical protein
VNFSHNDVSIGVNAMRKLILASGLMSLAFSASAGGVSCDDLKAKIAEKIDGKGVKGYSLTVLAKDAETSNRVVGSCEGGSKKIVYEMNKAKAAAEKT